MAGTVSPFESPRAISGTAQALAFQAYFYYKNTTILAPIFNDEALTIPAANPVVVAAGQIPPSIFLSTGIVYRRRIVYSNAEVYDLNPLPSAAVDVLSLTCTISETGAVSRSLVSKLSDSINVEDFGAIGDNVTNDTAAFTAAEGVADSYNINDGKTYKIDESTSLVKRISGSGSYARNKKIFPLNDTDVGNLALHETLFRLGDMTAFRTALNAGNAKIVFWGDSITEGISQVSVMENWVKLLSDEMTRRTPGKVLTFENFSISGRGVGEANSAGYVGTSGTVTPGTNFNQSSGAGLGIPDTSIWPGGTTVGKSWREHVRDRNADLLIIALSINDTADPNAVYATLKSLYQNYILTWTKVPSVIIVTPTMPTRLQPTQLAQQPFIEGNAHGLRALADEINVSLVDANRLWFALRDGVDIRKQRMAYFAGVADSASFILRSGAAPTVGSGSLTFASSGITHRPVLHRDGVLRADLALSGSQVAGLWARSNPSDPNKAYVVQIQRGAPQVVLYYNSGAVASSAIPAKASYKLVYQFEGARHRVWVDDILYIDVVDAQRTSEGYSGWEGTTGSALSNIFALLGYPRQISRQNLGEKLLLGPIDDYAINSYSLGGNALNHPSIIGHYHAVFAAFHGFLQWLSTISDTNYPIAVAPANVTDTVTPIVATDYLDMTINGTTAAAGSCMVGSGLNASLNGCLIVNVTNPATPVPVRLQKTGSNFLLVNVTVPTAGNWLFHGYGHVSDNSGTLRHGLRAWATRVA